LGFGLFSACGGKVIDENAPDHLLERCSTSRDCGGGLACLCGMCTRSCSTDAECGDHPGLGCATSDSGGFQGACYPEPDVPGICLERCQDGGCSALRSCTDGISCVQSGCDTVADVPRESTPVSFRRDVMPIFGLSCTGTMCHNEADHVANLYLGPRCKFDVSTKLCTFPDVEDTSGLTANPPAPLTDARVAAVYAQLVQPSATAPAVMRVVPGKPNESFIVDSILGRENDRGYECTNQDPLHEGDVPKPCGDPMPFDMDWCDNARGRASADVIIEWIRQGAHVD